LYFHPRYSKKLKILGISKAIDLVNAADSFIRKQTNVLGLKTAYELRGTSCLEITEEIPPKQSITVSRSFGNDVKDYDTLSQALCYFANSAAEKLRNSGQVAKSFTIFIRTNPFATNSKQYSNAATISFTYPTDATPTLLAAVNQGLKNIYKSEYVYKKAGIILTDLSPKTNKRYDLFDLPMLRERNSKLMHAIDKINLNYGRGTIFYASCGIKQTWLPKSKSRSGGYTSNWDEVIRAG
jgi:DNA polymerase V